MAPRTFYANAKAWARALCRHDRTALGLHASFAVLFDHESLFRTVGLETRKIVDAAVRGEPLVLRDPDATADWCAAEDIVIALAAIGARSTPDEYVLGSGVKRSIRDWVAAAYARTGRAAADFGATPGVRRPTLTAETGPALTHLGWRCEISFEAMVAKMVYDARARQWVVSDPSLRADARVMVYSDAMAQMPCRMTTCGSFSELSSFFSAR